MKAILYISMAAAACLVGTSLYGQRYPDRRYVRSGNKAYERQNYVESEVAYRRALEKEPDSYQAAFNLGNALYKQGNFMEAQKEYGQLATDTSRMEHAAQSYYNTGNALFKQRKLEQALEAYKGALRLNPDDREAKYNLAFTQKLLHKDQKGGGNNDQPKNKNDQNKDPNKNDPNKSQHPKDQNKKDPNKNQHQNSQNKPDQQPGQNPGQGGMSKEEADRMLEAVQVNEDKTREKQNGQKVKVAAKPSEKNW